MASAPAAKTKLADPRDTWRARLVQLFQLPPAQLDQPPVRLTRAQAKYHLGHLEAALADWGFLVEKKAVTATVLRYRAWTLAQLGKADESRAELAKFVDREKDPSTRSYAQIVLTPWLGEPKEVDKLLDAAVTAAGQDGDKLYNAACAATLAAEAFEQSEAATAPKLADRALQILITAVMHGYQDAKQLRSDVDLASLHASFFPFAFRICQ